MHLIQLVSDFWDAVHLRWGEVTHQTAFSGICAWISYLLMNARRDFLRGVIAIEKSMHCTPWTYYNFVGKG